MRIPFFPLVAAAFLASAAAIAQPSPKPQAAPLPAGVARVATVEGITEYRLPNGLKVLLFPDPSKPTITVNITYLVGSRNENYGETGMAHLLEHLMFKGTPKNRHIDQDFNKRGARSNGTTSLDRTNYFELFQASGDNLAWAIEMEADRMVNSFIAKKDLDSEMTVVRNEYEQGENSPFSVLLKRLQSIAYDWHSYGRSTIGNRSDIENVRIENLQAFYRTYYQPDNAVLLVAGKFDEAAALRLVAQHFGKIPKPKRKLPPIWTVEPTQDGDREFTVRRKGDVQAPTRFSATRRRRLHKALVETGKAAQVLAYPMMGVDPGLHLFGAVVRKGEPVEPVRDEIIKIVESFGSAAPTATEVERARQGYLNQAEKTLNNHESIGVALSEYIALGDWRLFFLARDELALMTPEKVQNVAKLYYRRDNRTVGFFLPEDNPLRVDIPPAPPVAEVMKTFKPNPEGSQAEAFDPTQDNINKRTKRFEVGGVKVALLSKKNRGETVNVSFALRLGNVKALAGQRNAADFAGRMLSRGTTKYTRDQLSDEYDRLKISGRIGGAGASFQTTRANLEAALKLAVHVLREPSFPESEFEQLRNQTITGIMSQMSEPSALAADAMTKQYNLYPKSDWRYTPTLEESLEDVKAAKLEDARRFHREFYGANVAEIAIVGDFDEARAAELVKELFAGWTTQVPFERVTVDYRDVPPVDLTVQTPDKENAVLVARQNVNMRDDDPDYPALLLANYIFGGEAGLDSRLMVRIRQKEGLSYGVGSELGVGSSDRAGAWSAFAIAAPQNMAKVEASFRDELARALKDGFTDAEVAAAKSGLLQQRGQTRAQDGAVAGGWVHYLHFGRTFEFSKQFEERVKAVTPAEILAALRKHLDPAKMSFVKAGDFAKAK